MDNELPDLAVVAADCDFTQSILTTAVVWELQETEAAEEDRKLAETAPITPATVMAATGEAVAWQRGA